MITNLDCLISVIKRMYDYSEMDKEMKHVICKRIYDILYDFSVNDWRGKVVFSTFHNRASYSEVRKICLDFKEKLEDGEIINFIDNKKVRKFIKEFNKKSMDKDTFIGLVKKGYESAMK